MTKSIKRKKRLFAWGTALLLVGGMQAALLPVDEPITPVDYVSTLVGTQSKHALSTGNTYPAVAMPWGKNFWTPQPRTMGDGWAYTNDADKIRGFKQTHQPSPWINDYGQFAIMPVTGKVVFNQDKRASWFSHKAEVAKPNYYRVYLADHDVVTEITPTERAAMFRFTFPESDNSYVIVDAFDRGSYVKIIPEENKIIGYTTRNSGGVPQNFRNYFVVVFDKPFTYKATVGDDEIRKGETEAKENHTGAIVGFSTLLVDTDDPEEKKQFVEIIQKNNELLLQLISDVLDLAKIESGIIELKLVEVDLRELCKELVVSMRIKVPAEVALCVVPDLPSYIMRCDKVRLTQIISNFINNAIKHTSKGTILLGYEIRWDEIEFSVTDTGDGMSPEVQRHVFDRFYKGNSFKQGTGLGLSICKSIIEQVGGKIVVESEIGKWSRFWFTLPR